MGDLISLKYVGDGGYVPGIPARDIEVYVGEPPDGNLPEGADIALSEEGLINLTTKLDSDGKDEPTGLYEQASPKPKPSRGG